MQIIQKSKCQGGLFALLLTTATAFGQFTIEWQTQDLGAYSGSGGEFTLRATLGQTEATAAPIPTDPPAEYSIHGGWWTFELETVLLPELNLLTDGQFSFLWWEETQTSAEPIDHPILEFSDDLQNWIPADPQPQVPYWEEPMQDRRFYRLRRE
jgi:hypothetical protein